jgi:hypothetical protein
VPQNDPRLIASALRLCSFSPILGLRAFPVLLPHPLLDLLPSRQLRRAVEEKTMTLLNVALLINAAANLLASLARLVAAIRRRQ